MKDARFPAMKDARSAMKDALRNDFRACEQRAALMGTFKEKLSKLNQTPKQKKS